MFPYGSPVIIFVTGSERLKSSKNAMLIAKVILDVFIVEFSPIFSDHNNGQKQTLATWIIVDLER